MFNSDGHLLLDSLLSTCFHLLLTVLYIYNRDFEFLRDFHFLRFLLTCPTDDKVLKVMVN
ncbi:hypothetical protein RchiOBHm_Chr5g0004651 [Rosa chinensis]|uniref:Uncharacterized protein n=1 Tax=Rosa chinensis TaxID=74649 RepID=A0A2P6Q334_ROSCH|nr:hypothetical protein RchiOBHm_Chr5g0004651 [Rosa chinensis]